MMVQLPPGAISVPAVHVPPVMEKVPPAVPTLVTTGVSVKISDPVAVTALVTVNVPAFVAVVAGVVTKGEGVGATIAAVAPVTVNGSVFEVPIGVVTPMFRMPNVAPGVKVSVVETEVEVTVKGPAVMPAPSPVRAVAPVRLAPVKVSATEDPRTPEVGVSEVSVAPWTVKGTVPLVPPGVVMLTLWTPSAAAAAMVKVAVAVVDPPILRPLTVMPPPDTLTAEAVNGGLTPLKLVPVKVTVIAVARTPEDGAIEVNVGGPGLTTVNVTALLTPPGAVTVTFLAEPVAVAAMMKLAVTVLSLTTVTPLTVMPPPETAIAVVPVSPDPVKVTGTAAPPRTAETGAMLVRTGPLTV